MIAAIQGAAGRENPDSGPDGVGVRTDGAAYTLEARSEVQMVAHSLKAEGFDASEDGMGRGVPLAPEIVSQAMSSKWSKGTSGPAGDEVANLIPVAPREVGASIGQRMRGQDDSCADNLVMAFESRFARNGRGAPSDVVPPLKAQSGESGKGDAAPLVAIAAPSLTATNDPSRSPQSSEVTQQVAAVHGATMQVRRLTPRECERLQGFPDDHTLIIIRGKPAADGPRYRALGNSMAVNCMRWIGERIDAAAKE